MTQAAGGSGAAYGADVNTGAGMSPEQVQAQLDLYADEAEQAVKAIRAKLKGWQESLRAAEDEAKRLRDSAKAYRQAQRRAGNGGGA
jgi:DNA repair ATPase RecN